MNRLRFAVATAAATLATAAVLLAPTATSAGVSTGVAAETADQAPVPAGTGHSAVTPRDITWGG